MTEVRNITWTDPAKVQAATCHGQPPRNPYATGYGRKIPTRYQLRYEGRWHRVYAMCYSNAATHYIRHGGAELVLENETEYRLECASRGTEPDESVIATIRKFSTLTEGGRTTDPRKESTP